VQLPGGKMKIIILLLTLTITGCYTENKIDTIKETTNNKPVVEKGQIWMYPYKEKDPFKKTNYFIKKVVLAVSNDYVLHKEIYINSDYERITSEYVDWFILNSVCIKSNKEIK
jgi:hypothetical protein